MRRLRRLRRRARLTARALAAGPTRRGVSYGANRATTNQAMTASSGDFAPPVDLEQELAVHHRDAFAWALNCCRRHRIDAEDVLQAAYVKVLEGRARFDGRSSFRTWLFGVVRLTAAQQRRRRFLNDVLAARAMQQDFLPAAAPPADADLAKAQERVALERALRLLAVRQREVVLLVFYHEMTVDEAARVMAIGAGSARRHYARAKARLRYLLDPRGEQP